MKVAIGGVEFAVEPDVEQQLLDEMLALILSKYETLGGTVQLGIKLMVRNKILAPMEEHVTEQFGKEAGRQVRPPRGEDPVAWAARLLMPQIGAMLGNATINLELASASDTITAIGFTIAGQSAGGGSLGIDRGDGIGQDSSTEISG